MSIQIMLLTKNAHKIAAAKLAFKDIDIKIIYPKRERAEIQADTSFEIAKHSALEAAKEYNVIAMREDHSLYINYLGFPGPYTKYIEKVLPVEKLLDILKLTEDRTGYFELTAVVAYPNGETKSFSNKVPIHIKKDIVMADLQSGWDSVICLEGENRAFSEYPSAERTDIWTSNFDQIAKLFAK